MGKIVGDRLIDDELQISMTLSEMRESVFFAISYINDSSASGANWGDNALSLEVMYEAAYNALPIDREKFDDGKERLKFIADRILVWIDKHTKISRKGANEMGSGKVYVVHNDWIKDPINDKMPYKIGKTTADSVVDGRFHGIGLIMPGKFVCDFAYEFDGEQYSEIEEMLHDLLDDSKVNGEWYWVNERVLKGIRRTCEKFGGRPITEEVTNEFAGEKKQRGESTKVLSGKKALRKEFWAYFIEYLEQHGTFLSYCKSRRIKDVDWFWIGAGKSGCSVILWINTSDSKIGCCLCIQSRWIKGNGVSAKKAYFKLKEEQEIIHKEIGEKLVWHRYCDDDDDHDSEDSEIGVTREGNLNERERWEEYSKWLKKYAELLYKTFSDRVKNLEL